MSVEPGFGGQKFMPEVLEKTKAVRELIDKTGKDIRLEVDGGINLENIAKAQYPKLIVMTFQRPGVH